MGMDMASKRSAAEKRPFYLQWRTPDVFALAMLLLVTARLAVGALHGVDLNFGDDARYLERGLSLHPPFLPVGSDWAVWGPWYQLWFWGLGRLQSNPVVLYYATVLVLGMTLPVLLYVLLRRLKTRWEIAFVISWLYALSYANWLTEPRVALFAAWVMLIGWVGVLNLPTPGLRWWALALLALMVAYVRPEFLMSAALFAVGSLLWFGYQRKTEHRRRVSRARIGALGLLSILTAALVLWWSFPFQQWRSVYAFGQHYFYNVQFCVQEGLDPDLHWEDVLARDFGAPASLGEAVRRNPAAFARHVGCNARGLLMVLGKVLLYHVPLVVKGYRWPEALGVGLVLLLIAGGCLLRPRCRRRVFARWRHGTVWVVIVWALPVVTSAFLIYPREHYLVQLVPLFWVGYAYLFLPKARAASRASARWFWVLPVVLLLLTPSFDHFFQKAPQHPRLEAVVVASSLTDREPLRVAGTRDSGYFRLGCYLFPREYESLPRKRSTASVAEYLQEYRPDMLLVSRGGLEFAGDATWQSLLEDSAAFGYRRIVLSTGDAWGPWQVFVLER